MITSKTWTYQLINDSITINGDFGLTILSVLLMSGDGTLSGSLTVSEIPSQPLPLVLGQPLKVSDGKQGQTLIDGITISTTGIVYIMGK